MIIIDYTNLHKLMAAVCALSVGSAGVCCFKCQTIFVITKRTETKHTTTFHFLGIGHVLQVTFTAQHTQQVL